MQVGHHHPSRVAMKRRRSEVSVSAGLPVALGADQEECIVLILELVDG